MKSTWKSLGHAILVLGYISLVGYTMFHANTWFGTKDTFLTPIAVLMLFVLSATIVGALVLGRPILLYLDGNKSEAIKFLMYTVGWLFVLTIVVFGIMVGSI